MSTEILSNSLRETLILKDVIPLAQGLGSAALMESQKPGWPTGWPNKAWSSVLTNSVRITMGGEEGIEHLDKEEEEQPSPENSVRTTRDGGGDEVSGDIAHNLLGGGQQTDDGESSGNYLGNAQTTMGGDNTDGSESYDPFPKVNAALQGGEEGNELYSLADSVRITASYEGDDWPDDDRPKRKRDIDEDEALHNDSVRITMGGVNGDDTEGKVGPGSSDPFEKSEAERRGR